MEVSVVAAVHHSAAHVLAEGPALNHLTAWLKTVVAPLAIIVIGLYFLFEAPRGQFAKILTKVGVAVIGLSFIVAGASWMLFSEQLGKLVQ